MCNLNITVEAENYAYMQGVEKAGGVIYNDNGAHIAANNNEFLQVIKDSATLNNDEKVIVVKDK